MTKQQRADFIVSRLEELYPETPIPLDHTDAYTLLVAVLLSAQCTDVRVNQVTPALFALADTPEGMMKVPVEKILEVDCMEQLNCYYSPQSKLQEYTEK